jgi:hypothetical protein
MRLLTHPPSAAHGYERHWACLAPMSFRTVSSAFGFLLRHFWTAPLAPSDFSSSTFGSLLSAFGCFRQRHRHNFVSASSPLSAGSAAAFDSAFARCHGSRLFTLRLPFVHRSAVPFLIPPTLGRFSRVLPGPRVLPGANAHFVPPFSVFPLADPLSETARAARPC